MWKRFGLANCTAPVVTVGRPLVWPSPLQGKHAAAGWFIFLQCLTPILLTGSDVILASTSCGLQLHLLVVQVDHRLPEDHHSNHTAGLACQHPSRLRTQACQFKVSSTYRLHGQALNVWDRVSTQASLILRANWNT